MKSEIPFYVGSEEEKLLKLGQLIYKNEEAKQFCFRTHIKNVLEKNCEFIK